MQTSRFLVVAIVLAGLPPSARADSVGVLFNGEQATAHEREVALSAIVATLRIAGQEFVTPTLKPGDRTTVLGCVTRPQPWSCMHTAVPTGLDRFMIASIDHVRATNGATAISIAVQIVEPSLDTVIGDLQTCEDCTDARLTHAVGTLTRDQLRAIAIRLGRTTIEVTSVPRGVRVTFDGDSFGATNTTIHTYAGPHKLQLELEGYRREYRDALAVDGGTTEIAVTMLADSVRAPARTDTPGNPAHSRVVPSILLGAGAVAIITGAVWLIADEDPVTRAGIDVSASYRDTGWQGAITLAGGVIVGGLGAWLWWRESRSTPTVAPTSGGAVVGLARSF